VRAVAQRLDLAALHAALRAHSWLLLIVAAYGALLVTFAERLGREADFTISLYWVAFAVATPVFGLLYVIGRAVYVAAAVHPARLGRFMRDDLRETFFRRERLFAALPIFLALPAFMSMFSSFKALIPAVQPFAWDATFATWDQALHFGRHPWEWLQPILGHPYVASALNLVYHLWFFVMYAIWMWQAFSARDRVLRMRYFLSFVLLWAILGTGMAMLFSSAGPCYFGRVTGLADPYAGLMAFLYDANANHSPVWALAVQEKLWTEYLTGAIKVGSGISAMPSMHIATAVLFALFGWQVGRRLGIALTVFAALIFLGSIQLGWHYAIDGYVAAAGTALIWWGVGWLLARDGFFRRPARTAPA
jgi:hypothetical protein